MKQILFYLLLCCGIVFAACDSDNVQEKNDIRLGTDNITEVSLNKLSTRTIILSGGTGKYMVNVADSKVADVKISKDTLRISGNGRDEPMPPSFLATSKSVWKSTWWFLNSVSASRK